MNEVNRSTTSIPNGAAAAALLAAAFGAFALGLIVLLHETGVIVAPTLYAPAGAVTGRTALAVGVWLIVWVGLHRLWRASNINLMRVTLAAVALIVLGIAGTFPPLWELLGA